MQFAVAFLANVALLVGAVVLGGFWAPVLVGAWFVGGYLLEFALLLLASAHAPSTSLLQSRSQTSAPPVVYCDAYNITACGLERLHPFDSCKYRKVVQQLRDKGVLSATVAPRALSRRDLLTVHTRRYLASLHYSLRLTAIFEVPVCALPASLIRWRVLAPMLRQSGGTLAAAELAMDHGWGINVGGGFHHAHGCGGSGFCAIADLSIAVAHLRRTRAVRKVLIVDVDAHQGNGHERDFAQDEDVRILDVYNPRIFPGDFAARAAIDYEVKVTFQDDDEAYLAKLGKALEAAREFEPDVIFYNAGTDCLKGDPLGNLSVSVPGIALRDGVVFEHALTRRVPIVMVLSGGYTPKSATAVANSMEQLHNRFGLFSPSSPDP